MSHTLSALETPSVPQRLASIDAYRGLVMFLMMAEILHFNRIAKAFEKTDSFWGEFWRFLAWHQTHVPWVGCTLHDLIQPSFSFLVGVALPFSLASRQARGQSLSWMTAHAFWRATVLVLLGVFLRSIYSTQTNWTFEDTLSQIGLGYGFLFLIALAPLRARFMTLVLILVGYWAAFALYPLPGENFDWAASKVSADWEHNLTGFAAHWNKNTNAAWAFDVWFLNLFPRENPFQCNSGGYATLSFIPTLATMILGVLAGNLLRSRWTPGKRFGILLLVGLGCLGLGYVLGVTGICPVVKRIWTPSWVLFSGGWCFLFLAAFYVFVDLLRQKVFVFPFLVIGANSIVAYLLADTPLKTFFAKSIQIHFGKDFLKVFGENYEQLILGTLVLLIYWLILLWLYRRRIYIKI